ncbi:zinc finger protein 239-like isoform X1 [Polypterus senegalus]|uniref:zinc finger protein 239-like isoform X1 n=1 Tax=Polypterus senegalus TaxID=55291 RepID=UPI0019634878|nr:zinc finger protein 239-like isoform X1 [Polypterus senegalus]
MAENKADIGVSACDLKEQLTSSIQQTARATTRAVMSKLSAEIRMFGRKRENAELRRRVSPATYESLIIEEAVKAAAEIIVYEFAGCIDKRIEDLRIDISRYAREIDRLQKQLESCRCKPGHVNCADGIHMPSPAEPLLRAGGVAGAEDGLGFQKDTPVNERAPQEETSEHLGDELEEEKKCFMLVLRRLELLDGVPTADIADRDELRLAPKKTQMMDRIQEESTTMKSKRICQDPLVIDLSIDGKPPKQRSHLDNVQEGSVAGKEKLNGEECVTIKEEHLDVEISSENALKLQEVIPSDADIKWEQPEDEIKIFKIANEDACSEAVAHLEPNSPLLTYAACMECGETFSCVSDLNDHQQVHSSHKSYTSTECGESMSGSELPKVHKRSRRKDKPYSCPECGKSFSYLARLKTHKRTHVSDKPCSCPACGKSFGTPGKLKRHQRIHTEEKPHVCNVCGKSFNESTKLKVHQRIHTGEKPFTCIECGKSFSQIQNLKSHQKHHAGEKPYSCNECGKTFGYLVGLKVHQRTHTGERPYSCSECGKSFSQSGQFKIHLRTHTGEKPYSCSDCGKSFIISGKLKIHKRIHTEEKPYSCSDCGKCFSESGKLKIHQRIHTGERPYTCPQCHKSFAQVGTFKKHQMIHFREKPSTANEAEVDA